MGLLAFATPGYADPLLQSGTLLPPFNTSPPVISGSAVPGNILTCSTGSWEFSPSSYSFSWQRDFITQIGTGNQYTVTGADVGQPVTCQVVASNDLGSSTPTPSPPVVPSSLPAAGAPLDTAPPGISGDATPGQTLTCSSGAWLNSPTSYSYSWQSSASNIAGQTGSQYVVRNGDVGNPLTCTVVASNASGSGPPAISLPVIPLSTTGSAGGGTAGSGGGTGGSGGSGGPSGSGGTGGGSSGGGKGVQPPKLKSLAVTPRRVAVIVNGRRLSTKGTAIRYSLDRAASLLIAIQQRRHGRWYTVRVIAVMKARPGTHSVRYDAHQGKKILSAGSCRVIAAAMRSGTWSHARRTSFTVFDKKVKHKPKHHPR